MYTEKNCIKYVHLCYLDNPCISKVTYTQWYTHFNWYMKIIDVI